MEPVRRESVKKLGEGEGSAKRGARKPKVANVLEDDEGDGEDTEQEDGLVKKTGKLSVGAEDDLFGWLGGGTVVSPLPMGEETLDKMKRDQMQEFVDGLWTLDANQSGGPGKGGEVGALI